MPRKLQLWIRLWFVADVVLALLPQLHWAASSGALVFGVPRAIVYLFGLSAFVAASTVAAYAFDPTRPANTAVIASAPEQPRSQRATPGLLRLRLAMTSSRARS